MRKIDFTMFTKIDGATVTKVSSRYEVDDDNLEDVKKDLEGIRGIILKEISEQQNNPKEEARKEFEKRFDLEFEVTWEKEENKFKDNHLALEILDEKVRDGMYKFVKSVCKKLTDSKQIEVLEEIENKFVKVLALKENKFITIEIN